ncbi:MAG: lactate utilization protein [Bacillota bacterium]
MSSQNPMYEPEKWYNRHLAEKCVEALRKKGFTAYFAETKDKAKRLALEAVPPGASVGIGGSVTIRELGIHEALKERGNTVYDHWDASLSPTGKTEARDRQITADVFMSSTNALTMNGTLVNIDGTGNRVASMIFGPKASVVVCGYNKIVPTLEDAVRRVRKHAAPVNYKRLNAKAPCLEDGDCDNCPGALCRVTTIIEGKPSGKTQFVVIIVGEKLGY